MLYSATSSTIISPIPWWNFSILMLSLLLSSSLLFIQNRNWAFVFILWSRSSSSWMTFRFKDSLGIFGFMVLKIVLVLRELWRRIERLRRWSFFSHFFKCNTTVASELIFWEVVMFTNQKKTSDYFKSFYWSIKVYFLRLPIRSYVPDFYFDYPQYSMISIIYIKTTSLCLTLLQIISILGYFS